MIINTLRKHIGPISFPGLLNPLNLYIILRLKVHISGK